MRTRTKAGAITPGQIAAVAAGNALEFYDFLTYGFFAAQIGRAFFPSSDPTASLLAALATFGVGFLMRPVGAAALGQVADRAGRKPAMLLSFLLMGLSMAGMALIPSHASIGALAGWLAVLCRMIQGFALGGEIGPSTAFMIEAAPADRRGFFVSLQFVSQQAGVLASGLVGFALAHALPEVALDAWGWRVAFLIGLLIVPFGLILRNRLVETLDEAHRTARPAGPIQRPAGFGLTAFLGLVLLAGGTTVNYLGNYMTLYATQTLHLSSAVGFTSTIVVGAGGLVSSAAAGWLGDRHGRRPIMIWPWTFLFLVMIPMFMGVAATRSPWALWGATLVMAVANQLFSTNVLVILTERLPMRMRGRGLGLIYALSISVFGGSTQFIVAWLTKVTHSPLAPAWYATAIVALSLVAALALPRENPLADVGVEDLATS
jgi:MFS family permease